MYNMRNLIMIIAAFMSISLTGCLKDNPNVDFSKLSTVVEMPYSGKAFFSGDALNFTSDTITLAFTVNIASAYPLSKDLSVTVGIDESLVADYNAYDPSVHYEVMPANAYSFSESTFTIPAGSRLDTLYVTFYKPALDPAVSYMLPITIKDASGETISGNLGTHYYHAIGNPLAGNYFQSFYRWNDVPDTTGPPNSTVFEDELITVSPESATTLLLPESYLQTFVGVSAGISLSFTNDGGVFSNFSVSLNDATTQGLANGGFTVVTAPKLVSYQIVGDASTKYAGSTFRTYMEVLNSSGGNRKLVDNFVKQ